MSNLSEIAKKFKANYNAKSTRKLTPIHKALYDLMRKSDNKVIKFDACEKLTEKRINEREIKDADVTEKIYDAKFVTVQNGFEAAICDGKTNAQINFNDEYEYKVVKVSAEVYTLVKK